MIIKTLLLYILYYILARIIFKKNMLLDINNLI